MNCKSFSVTVNPLIPPSFIMFSSSLFTLILVSLQRGLAPIFYTQGPHTLYQFILKILGKTVKIINKCIFKCISVFYTFSTRLLKTQCNMWNKVIRMPVEMWKTKYQFKFLICLKQIKIVVQILCGKLYRMPWRIGVEKHHFCSDVREQSITLSPINVNTSVYIL